MGNVWVVDDDSAIRWVIKKSLQKQGIECTEFEQAELAIAELKQRQPDVLITDIKMPGIDGFELTDLIKQQYPTVSIIMMTAYSDLNNTVHAYQLGVFEYLPKPFDINELNKIVSRCLQQDFQLTRQYTPKKSLIIGESSVMQGVFRMIGRLSTSAVTVLIQGETGTGKELIAKALHEHSTRKKEPFIALNMAAIPHELIESELFGHEKGAFTGAIQMRLGKFEQAHGGTLFLDEIGDMPLQIQTRLLRVLADGEFYRIGGHKLISIDVRIIAATHQNLNQLVQKQEFREDLYHRLNVIQITLPALKDRNEDIPLLCDAFLLEAANNTQTQPKILANEVIAYFKRITWPGNIRQLKNICHWLTVMSSSDTIYIEDLPSELQQNNKKIEDIKYEVPWYENLQSVAKTMLINKQTNIITYLQPKFEQAILEAALEVTTGNKKEAAYKIGWGRNTVTRKLKGIKD